MPRPRFPFPALVALVALATARPEAFAGTLLSYDFEGTNPWPALAANDSDHTVATGPYGSIDVAGGKDPSGGLRLVAVPRANPSSAAALLSGPLPLQNREPALDRLTLAFTASVSRVTPLTVRVESFDAAKKRTGGLETTLYPAAPDYLQRFAVELGSMKPFGGGAFDPTAPYVGFTFGAQPAPTQSPANPASTPAPATDSPPWELRLDNVHFASPAFYVNPKGSDAADGRTEATALATPQAAINRAQPGDIILVAAGTYLPNGVQEGVAAFTRPGTPAAWITLKNQPGQRPVFTAAGAWSAIKVGSMSKQIVDHPALAYLEMRGLHVRGDADLRVESHKPLLGKKNVLNNANGITVEGRGQKNPPHHIRIADNIVEFCAGGGISYTRADWALIEGNISRNNCWWMDYAGSGISIMEKANFDVTEGNYKHVVRLNVVSGNRCFAPWVRGNKDKDGNPIPDKISDGNGIIVDVNRGHLGRKLIQGNLVFGNGGSGIHAYKSDMVDIIHNTAYFNNASPELKWGQIFGSRANDIRIINNIMWAPPDKPMDFELQNQSTRVLYAHNVYFGGDSQSTYGGGFGAESGSGQLAETSGNIHADPGFVNPSLDYQVADFRLRPDSPALTLGQSSPFAPLMDLDGRPVPSLAADLGAYQRPPTPPVTAATLAPSAAPAAATPVTDRHPFPHDHTYAHGIRPSAFSQAQMNADLHAMWQAWRKTYLLSEGAAPGELRVSMGGARGVAISEGTGYGLLISVYLAAPGNSGKADFDAIYRYYRRHEKVMNGIHYGLMAWRVGPDNKIADNWVAPDGDIDAAFALLVADRKWGGTGEIDYRAAATGIINNLMKWSVNKPSFTVSRGEFESGYTMSSYHIVNYFPAFAAASGDARWLQVIDASYAMYAHFLKLNPDTGLTPFTFNVKDYGYSKRGYTYGYDSSRVPWRVGVDYLWHGTAHSPLARILPDTNAKWLKAVTRGRPAEVNVAYTLDGTAKGTNRDPRVTVPPIAVGAMVDASNQEWLDTLYRWIRVQVPGVETPEARPSYFGDAVMLSCMLVLTGNMPDLDHLPATSTAAPASVAFVRPRFGPR